MTENSIPLDFSIDNLDLNLVGVVVNSVNSLLVNFLIVGSTDRHLFLFPEIKPKRAKCPTCFMCFFVFLEFFCNY